MVGGPVKHEIGDGTRFAELAYVWDPNTIWTLLVRCTYQNSGRIFQHFPRVVKTVHNQLKLLGGQLSLSDCCGAHVTLSPEGVIPGQDLSGTFKFEYQDFLKKTKL
ncbi:unnamed protein product [Pocillopora meandrina]|uniref:Uncharacterized protein n=1 Tax=Pocillopora meandrina TaxID=46732 RepID=A0AAU9X048_9CNID|nr:unnamed protein product [Pocillopora meandrina]